MKTIIPKFLFILILLIFSCIKKGKKTDNEIKPYVEFLRNENTSAKDYIIDIFKEKDLVLICERFHPEFTQYELIVELCKDDRFIKNVGNIFIEVCTRNYYPEVDQFLKDKDLSKVEIDSLLKEIARNRSVHPISINTNFPFFLKELRLINKNLKTENKLNLFPTDVPINWTNMNAEKYEKFWKTTIKDRDRLMAEYIIEKFDSIQNSDSKRKKALIIMNYRHAFGNEFKTQEDKEPENVGRYLFKQFPDRIANVLINTLTFSEVRSDNDADIITIQDGKWDASFKRLNKDNIGFDFENSPFGKDKFDLWPFVEHNISYSQVFNGFVYYTSVDKFKLITGVSDIVDSSFISELKRRKLLVNEARNLNFSTNDSILWSYNRKKINDTFITDSIKISIDKWLK